jgi:Calcineurin-like phosphoesterase/Purple acid Phosphatase, N-terminal domain
MSEIQPFSKSDFSRRRFIQTAGGLGLLVATYSLWKPSLALAAGPTTTGSGTTPEQVHLTWPFDSVNNPTNAVVVSWLQPHPSNGGFVVFAAASNPSGLTGAGTTTVDATVNTQQGGNLNANSTGAASGLGPFPAAGSPSGTFMGFAFSYQDQTEGSYVYAYSAVLSGLLPNTAYVYAISDGNGNYFPTPAAPATFTTAPSGRTAFTFSSYGDLATPTAITSGANAYGDVYAEGTANDTYSTWAESSANSYQAVNAVEHFAPLFHLINGDLSYADKNATQAPEVWRDFGMSVQRSAMNRPWMPCLGNHEAEVANGYSSYLSRYVLPGNGAASFPGNFYDFQVGSVLIISLDANDVVYQDSNAYASTSITGSTKWGVGANCFDRYYTGTPSGTYPSDSNLKSPAGNAQTECLQNVLASARPGQVPVSPPSSIATISSIDPTSIDWIVVQMHQCVMSSSDDNGCDKGIREIWKPLFDQYQVDLVVNGHDHDYERSQPVHGYTALQGHAVATPSTVVETLQPAPVPGAVSTTTASSGTVSLINSTEGTVYLVLGGGGTNAIDNVYQPTDGAPANAAGVHTVIIRKTGTAGTSIKPPADAYEPVVWSALTDPAPVSGANTSYGIALFEVNPGDTPGGSTTLTVTYYHCPENSGGTAAATTPPVPGTNPGYVVFDQFVLTRLRSDGPSAATPEFALPAVALAGAAAVGAGALYLSQRDRASAVTVDA